MVGMKTKVQKNSTLLEVLQGLSPDSSKNTLKSWVEKGRVWIGSAVAKKAHVEVKAGQEVAVGPKTSFTDEGIKIVYEDRYLVVLDKPDALLSVATMKEEDRTAHTILKRRLGKAVFAVHRLDRDTSGLMMFTYTKEARDRLKKQFEVHAVLRHYIALVQGILKEKSGTWKSYLREDESYRVYSAPSGQLAITHYEVLDEKPTFSCVKFALETGRKNQIRVHCQDAGHSILGDEKYGSKMDPYHRLCLHAFQLEFVHPFTNKKLSFKSNLPPEFRFGREKKIQALY